MQQAIIAARPDYAWLMRRFSQGIDRGVMLRANSIAIDRPAGGFQGIGVGSRQVGADLLPALPLVSGFEDLAAADIDGVAVVRREDDRISPGEAVFVGLRAQASRAARPSGHQADLLDAMIVALQAVAAAGRAANGADEDDIGVIGMHSDITALARADDVAIFPSDGGIAAAAGHAQAGVVLLRPIHIVGLMTVEIEMVDLRCGLVVYARPGKPAIQGDASAAIVAMDHDAVVARMDPQVMVIAVGRGDLSEVMPAIGRFPEVQVVDVNRIGIDGVGGQVHIIPGARDKAVVLAADDPALAIIIAAIDAAIGLVLDDGPEAPGLRWGGCQADLAHQPLWQTLAGADILPAVAAIHGPPDAAVLAA